MAEGTYEYECMRAELLGVEKPDYEEFMKNKVERDSAELVSANAEEQLREEQAQQEKIFSAKTKLDELNNIIKSTQQRINNFTAPISRFVRSKIGRPSEEDISTSEIQPAVPEPENNVSTDEGEDKPSNSHGQGTIDSMIKKCNKAHSTLQLSNLSLERLSK